MIKLLLKSNEESREMEFADLSISIGRSTDNLIPLADKKASRKHASIEKTGDHYRVRDLGSGNGTRVNGHEITDHPLAKGDEIKIGLTTIYVLEVDAPARAAAAAAPPPIPVAVVATPARAPEPVAAAAPLSAAPPPLAEPREAAPESSSEGAQEGRRRNTRRSYDLRRSSSGGFLGLVAALIIMGGLGYAGWHFYLKEQLQQNAASAAPVRAEKKAAPSKEADDALASLEAKVKASEAVTDPLLAEAGELAQKFGSQNSSFEYLVLQLKQKKEEQAGKAKLAEVEVQVTNALRDNRYADALDALKPLKNAYESPSTAALVNKILTAARSDFKNVEDYGKKLVDQKSYSLAVDHYRSQTPRFRGTEFFKYLSDKPERLDELAKADQALALARERAPAPAPVPAEPKREPELAKVTPKEPAPEPPKEMPKEEPKKETPKPAPKPAPEPPKEMAKEMPKPAPKEPPKPPPKEPPAMPAPPKEEKKEDAGAAKSTAGFKKPDKLCDCKKIVKGVYCIKCDRVLEPDDLRKGVCKRCEEKPKKVDMCIKRYYEVDGKPETISEKPFTYEGKQIDIPHESRSRIVYFCESCEEVGDTESDVKHKADCKNKFNLIKVCLKSGSAPHVPK